MSLNGLYFHEPIHLATGEIKQFFGIDNPVQFWASWPVTRPDERYCSIDPCPVPFGSHDRGHCLEACEPVNDGGRGIVLSQIGYEGPDTFSGDAIAGGS